MNGALAVVIAAVLCIAAIVGWVVISERLDRAQPAVPAYEPRHVPRPAVTLPVAGRLEPVPDWLDEDELDAGWWAQTAPPDAVEVLTGPDRRIAQPAQLTTAVLERMREGLHDMPGDGTSATFRPAPGVTMPVSDDPDTTGVQPVALRTWGKTAPELAAELAARYLT